MRWLRLTIILLILRPALFLVTGSGIRGRHRLPSNGPGIVIANHNSHLDALVLMAALPWRGILRARPIVAGDYFATTLWGRILVLGILGGVPIARQRKGPDDDPLAPAKDALNKGSILIFFPEGTRGEPEQFGEVKKGLGYLIAAMPDTAVTPVWLTNLGRSWPRGAPVPVPLACRGWVGRPMKWTGAVDSYIEQAEARLLRLSALVSRDLPPAYDYDPEYAPKTNAKE
ncbi:MAG: 1-acyl-sn-glycerol-3-phosphate acyltransferase [Alphaproteobacteria bacterium]|nr:1-acyl-sn-glycerol-3-phosphate acyltransferase [Alphaproteobacteria bacterium SS10]